MFPSLLSPIAFVTSRVYVRSISRVSSSKYTMTLFPFILCLGDFFRGGERNRLLGSFTTTYSLNSSSNLVFSTGTLVAPGSGYSLVIIGGIVSLGPPLGGVVVFAHECENIIDPSMMTTGMTGKNFDRNCFIIVY